MEAMTVTADEIAEALGLVPFMEWGLSPELRQWRERERAERGTVDFARGTGRTTRMLCSALAQMSVGEAVYISGHSPAYTRQLVYTARAYAHRIGIDPGLATALPRRMVDRRPVYLDHYQVCP